MEPINLFKDPKRFAELPMRVKLAIATFFAGWLAHFFLILSIFRDQIPQTMLLQQGALAVISCFVLLKLKNWARILCITGNVIVILFYLVLLATVMGASAKTGITALAVMNLALFAVSTFFLWSGESADFFKRQSPPRSGRRARR